MLDINFYKNKRVLVTGHTGFKGTWLCFVLKQLGADIFGYALKPETKPNLFEISGIEEHVTSFFGDIRNYEQLKNVIEKVQPEIIIHLAAQPLVRESYNNPVYTYETNVLGTVNILECIRTSNCVKSFLNITTDKVYLNREWEWGYRENEEINGYDPYSNSKSCSELVTQSYIKSFFNECDISISTARAGNVIGGGDFSNDRIIPDCIRAAIKNEDIIVRNPLSIRPYQHVLEPIYAYLLIIEKQYKDHEVAGSYNVGPSEKDCISTSELVDLFLNKWGGDLAWINKQSDGPHEANYLRLDCSKIKSKLNWKPKWDIEDAIDKTVEWTKCWLYDFDNLEKLMEHQINTFLFCGKDIDKNE